MSDAALSPASRLRIRARRQWIAFFAIAAAMVVAALLAAGEVGRARAMRALEAQAETDASLKVALLNAALERPRALPLVLAGDSDIRLALETRSAAAVDRVNRKLEGLIEATQASVIYVIGADGVAMAASNFREPDSFVGSSYAFRDYFGHAMERGGTEQYALGTVSLRPGLYISRRVENEAGEVLGVVVAKVEFNRLEADWSIGGRPVYVTDGRGIVLMTSVPDWRFLAVAPISNEQKASIADSLQFGDARLDPLPFSTLERAGEHEDTIRISNAGVLDGDYLRLSLPVPTTGWRLHFLLPVAETVAAMKWQDRSVAFATLLPVLGLAGFVLRRRQQALRKIEVERVAREELERRVEARTRDLTAARDRLQEEISGHERTGRKLQSVQQELVQANRLAILGQVAAGVAHEINQPVATIRAFADNGRTLLDRGRVTEVEENLEQIAALTDRIGTITGDLKMLARKGRAAAGPTGMKDVIEGAVLLLRSRFAGHMDALDIVPPDAGLKVSGSRVRLEQIVINLLQNALEAVAGREDARVSVRVREEGTDEVVLTVSDNGPGLAAEIREALFTPFNTSKEAGLGLGLVISSEIAADYGGRIEVESGPDGASFSVHLRRA
ncbi:ATP-binding protein [Rhizobiaceae bacterium BDR2-2]|uniref:C4-dicarboxylate transport sensor protein n=1 Tax=Ectorhizobium quercum TaxID=2965071 RepID=A0AAE3MVB6_9HYPH|nr:ATP-binding protein [Ectorhizobium quercum]MCX8995853.1 ATP-binding protein [Ectorhizobium quercum]